jgi:hypothetical protein
MRLCLFREEVRTAGGGASAHRRRGAADPLGLEDPPFIVDRSVDECRDHRSIKRIHVFLSARLIWQSSLRKTGFS